MVVLDELCMKACGFAESSCIEAFIEKTSIISENLWFDNENVRNLGGDDVHRFSPANPCRYWP
ncbi:hypothetical protein D9M71_264190 [compost metagenome]